MFLYTQLSCFYTPPVECICKPIQQVSLKTTEQEEKAENITLQTSTRLTQSQCGRQ